MSFGVPDEMYGELVGAVVVLQGDAPTDASQERIQADMSKSLAKFKIPVRVWITDTIPKTYVSCQLTTALRAKFNAE